jgi:predicted dehydrogenase
MQPEQPQPTTSRRGFLKTAAAGATVMSMTAASYGRIQGANGNLRVAFLGVGGRCQAHLDIINYLSRNGGGVVPVGVCDVWNGNETVQANGGRGLYPSARKCNLDANDANKVTKDYRRILDRNDVDIVCVATPDHWHAKMCIDAAAAGKDVYCEKPMTKTIAEAHAVVDAMRRHNRVMTVGVQSMADPTWRMANEMIRRGDIGHVAQAQTSYYRNYIGGQWRYYRLTPDMNPTTIDWPMFLGTNFSVFPGQPLAPAMPFDRAIYGQWRCYWQFGGGMFTDLFVHQTTHMIAAMGVRYPGRVVGGGGIYLEYDKRDVPDVATVVADFNEGCQLIITATMINDHPIEEVIRGRLASMRFVNRTHQVNGVNNVELGIEVLPQNMRSGPGVPRRLENATGRHIPGGLPVPANDRGIDTRRLWQNFLECCRTRNFDTWSTPELGAAAFTTVNMGVLSYREGKVKAWDAQNRRPVDADATWAARWEQRSHQQGRPNQIQGWAGGDAGSVVVPPDYQRLAGTWTNGQDPAAPMAGGGN